MAQIKLGRYEVDSDYLPSVCMKCGAPATVYKRKQFAWVPPWAYAMPIWIVRLAVTRRMTVSAPLCEAHKNHWLVRTLLGVGGLLVFVAAFVGFMVLMGAVGDELDEDARGVLAGVGCTGAALIFLPWLILVLVLHYTGIRATEITDRSITLTGVSEAFVDALEAEREQWEEEEEDYRPRPRARRQRSDGVSDPRAPRRRLPPRDAYRESDE